MRSPAQASVNVIEKEGQVICLWVSVKKQLFSRFGDVASMKSRAKYEGIQANACGMKVFF